MSISAKIVADSITNAGIRLRTVNIQCPKFLDAEFEKHRMISSNSSSDRAIPILKALDSGYFLPDDVRLNQPGMQGDLLLDEDSKEAFWNDLRGLYGYTATILKHWDRVHKQHLNRYLMGFAWQKKIASATEWDNFFSLRLDRAADPAMYELALRMKEAMEGSIPVELQPGEWHLPYVDCRRKDQIDDLEASIKCSVARCARVSYLNHDNSNSDIDKDIALADKLLKAGHMSPLEHQLTPMEVPKDNYNFEKGVTHIDRDGWKWSGNSRGWCQYRHLI